MCRRHLDVDDPKPAPAQRLKDGCLVNVCPSHALKLSVSHLEVGVSPIVPSDVVRNIGLFFYQNLNMPHHGKQLCRKASLIPTLEYWQDTSPAQRQDSWHAGTRVRHLAPGLRKCPAPPGSRGTIGGSSRVCRTQRPALSPERQAGTQQRLARAAALAACQFPGGLQNPPPDLPRLAWSGASVPLSTADCLPTYQDPPLPFPATALPAQEQTKDVRRSGFLSRCTTHLERITQPSAGCELPWRLQDKPEDLPL